MTSLKNHPFAVEAFFESSLVLTFAYPKEELENLIPECLELDTFDDKWAFIAVAMVQTKGLRPKGFPRFLGNDFFLIGYRVFVKYITSEGKRLRGLFILKSETDKKKMEILGNIFTHYNYSSTDILRNANKSSIEIESLNSGFKISVERPEHPIPLPDSSPFSDWKEARRYAGPLPFTFTYNQEQKEVLIIEGVRENWVPQPVLVKKYEVKFLNELEVEAKGSVLANAFIIENIPYYWKKGRVDKWG